MIFLMAMWQFKKLQNRDRRERCRKIEWDLWIILAWDLAAIIWWWINFVRYLHEPTQFRMPGIFIWVSLWKYGYLIDFHPYSCVLHNIPTVAQVIKWALNTFSFVQWVVSAYVLQRTQYAISDYPTYDCLASQIPTAPGTSTCSASQICSRDLLFHSHSMGFSSDQNKTPEPGIYIIFICLSVVFLLGIIVYLFIWLGLPVCGPGSLKEYRELARKKDVGYHLSICGLSFLGIALMVFTAYFAINAVQRGRETSVAIDWDCKAVRVTLSPWRFYFDVWYQLPVRVVQMWFDV
jgi:hypothetical protein